jgi:hypothetical protein
MLRPKRAASVDNLWTSAPAAASCKAGLELLIFIAILAFEN